MADIITSEIEIQSGVVSSGLCVGMNGGVTVLSGATVTDASAFEYGYFWVDEGGLVRDIYLHDSGDVFLNGGRAENLTMETGGQADVYGGVLQAGTILNGGVGVIYTGATGSDVTVSDGGRFLLNGGKADNTLVSSGGSFVVQLSGGVAEHTTLYAGAHARIVSGGETYSAVLSGGRLEILYGQAYNTDIQSGGSMELISGHAYNTEVRSDGVQRVSAAGEAHRTTLNGGVLTVDSGTVYDTNVVSGSAVLQNAAAFRLNLYGGTAEARSGTCITGGALYGGVLVVSSGAILVRESFVNGKLEARSGALVSSGILFKGGLMTDSGAIYRNTLLTGGTMYAASGAVVEGTTVSKNGELVVLDGGFADTVAVYGETSSSSGGTIISYTSSSIFLVPGSSASSASAPVSGGILRISGGGRAAHVVISSGALAVGGVAEDVYMDKGTITILSGGTASGVKTKGVFKYSFITGGSTPPDPADAYVYVEAGGLLQDAELAQTQMTVGEGAVARDLFVSAYCLVTVSSGATLTGRMSFITGATVTILSGGIIDFDLTSHAPGAEALFARGMDTLEGAPAFTVTVGADQAEGRYRLADGVHGFDRVLTVRNTALETLGTLTVDTLTEIGGRYYLLNEKHDSLYLSVWSERPDITADPAAVYVNPAWEGLAHGTTVDLSGGGAATIGYDAFAGTAAATDAVASPGTVVIEAGELSFAENVVCDVDVRNGAVLSDTVFAHLGSLVLRSGAVARNITFGGYGALTVEKGAKVVASFDEEGNGGVQFSAITDLIGGATPPEDISSRFSFEGTLDFDISNLAGCDAYLVSGLSAVQSANSPSFTLTVGDDQAEGVYKLAYSVGHYDSVSISIVDKSGTELGVIAVTYTPSAYYSDGRISSYRVDYTEAVINGYRYALATSYTGYGINISSLDLTIRRDVQGSPYIYVNSGWSGRADGSEAYARNPDTGNAASPHIGTDAFVTLDAAMSAAAPGAKIVITGGSFSDAISQYVILDGGTVGNTSVTGTLDVRSGRTLDLTVAAGGTFLVNQYGRVERGTFDAASSVTIDGELSFDLTGLQPGNTPLYDGLAYVGGSPNCLIRVGNERTPGVYVLGVNAQGFAPVFSINKQSSSGTIIVIGTSSDNVTFTQAPDPVDYVNTLTVGETLRKNGTAYTIAETDGVLTLSIETYVPPDVIHVSTAWTGLNYGDVVTLSRGGTATFGIDAFASLPRALAAGGTASVSYLEEGFFLLDEVSKDQSETHAVALSGTTLSGYVPFYLYLTVEDGAVCDGIYSDGACFITVKAGGVLSGETLFVSSKISAQYTRITLHQGAILEGSFSCDAGRVVLENVRTLGGNGSIVIGEKCALTGSAAFTEFMDVTVNGTLDFDISGMTAGDSAYLFRGLSHIKGELKNFTLTVSAKQEDGIYLLAEDAAGFGGAMSVVNVSGATIGVLEIGRTVQIAGSFYTLRGLPSDGKYFLYLVVGEQQPPDTVYVNTRWTGKEFGAPVDIPGGTAIYLYDAFSDGDAALDALGGGSVVVTGGSVAFRTDRVFTGSLTVNGATVQLLAAGTRFSGEIAVKSGGSLFLANSSVMPASITVKGGTLGGTCIFTDDMFVSFDGSGTILFDLNSATAGGSAFFENLSYIKGTPTLTVTTAASLEKGDYLLATGAAGFTGIELRIGSSAYSLGIDDARPVMVNGVCYRLFLSETGELTLSAGDYGPPPAVVYFSTAWMGKTEGDVISNENDSNGAIYGYDAFSDAARALDAVVEGGTVVVEYGKFSAVDLTKPCSLDVRGTEAEFSACTVVAGSTITVRKGKSSVGHLSGTITVSAGGVLSVEAESRLTAVQMTFDPGAVVTVNGILEFDISGSTDGGPAAVSGLSAVQGAPVYELKLSGSQADGRYVLATDAASFAGVITVKNTWGEDLGTLSVGGMILYGGRTTYSLGLDEAGELCLTVISLPNSPVVHFDSAWMSLQPGASVTLSDGSSAIVGYDAFGSGAGFLAIAEGGTAIVWNGLITSDSIGDAASVVVRGGTFGFRGTVGSGRIITVSAGGTLSGSCTVGSGGAVTLEADATLSDGITVSAGGVLTALSGATLSDGVTISIGGVLRVSEGTTISARDMVISAGSLVTVNGTIFFDISGMTASDAAISSGLSNIQGAPTYVLTLSEMQAPGRYVLSADAGSFDGFFTVKTDLGDALGTLSVGDSFLSGKNLYELTLDASGNLTLTVSRAGSAACVHMNSEWDGMVYGMSVTLPDGSPAVFGYDAFGSAEGFNEVASNGLAVIWGGRIVSNGIGVADNVIVRGGKLELVNASFGSGRTITVTSGATLSGAFTVAGGGAVTVEVYSTLSARHVVFESGASIRVDGVIDFDVTGLSAGGAALFHGLARVQGTPYYTLTVSGSESKGLYTLATDAGNFSGVITVKNASGTEFGTLSVGEGLNVGDLRYSLSTDGLGSLFLEVSDKKKPARIYANSDWIGLADGTVVVLLDGSTAVIGYDAFGGDSAFYGIPVNGTVVLEKGGFGIPSGTSSFNLVVVGDVSLTGAAGMTITVEAGGRLSAGYLKSSSGSITVEAGGTLSVNGLEINSGVSIVVNGVLDLDISRGSSGSMGMYLPNGWTLVQGSPSYTLTVSSSSQATGSFYLTQSSNFYGTFTVVNTDGEVLGTLPSDGTPLDIGDRRYALKNSVAEPGASATSTARIVVTDISEGDLFSYTYVNPEWAGLADGTEVTMSGGTVAVIGRDAFASFAPALEACRSGVYIEGGTVQASGSIGKTVGVRSDAVLVVDGKLSAGLTVYDGGTAEGVVLVNGRIDLNRGVLRNFTITAGKVFSYGKLTGRMNISANASVMLMMGTVVDFDLAQADGSAPLLNNLQVLNWVSTPAGAPSPAYTITVDGFVPESGTREYKLAGGATFLGTESMTFTVMNKTGDSLGTIRVGGSLTWNDAVYSLRLNESESMLVLTVAAPDLTPPVIVSVTASTEAVTNKDITLTVLVTDDGQMGSVYYRLAEDGEWNVYDSRKGVTVSQNGVVYFKAADKAGNVSEIVGYTVGNIDRTPPTMPGSLRAGVSGNMAALNWNASWDASGIAEYIVTYRNGDQEFTVSSKTAGLVLENLSAGTWTWSVRAVDNAWNASGFANGGTFTVTDDVVPEYEKRFFIGDFAGSGRPVLAKVSGGVVTIPGENGGLWGSLALEDGWSVAGVGDFDGDGRDDILRINAAGYVVGEMSNGDGSFTAQVLNFRGAGWDILGVGDFDGDGKDDVLVANPAGASDTVGLLGYWKGGTEWTLVNGYSATWEMVSTGDFDGDGKCDMLWRNSFEGEDGLTYNAFCTWILDPAEGESDWRMVSVAAPDEWNFLCSGDFDGDGTADIAMINMEGVVGIWGMKNGWLDSWSILSAVDTTAWTLVGVGDFDGDGTDDIAWRNPEAGIAGCWQIEDKQLASWQPLAIIA